jgi:CRISPR-associated protein Cas5d
MVSGKPKGGAMAYAPVEVKVWGEYACFTRPEMKVERVSYEVMTPSAARGVLDAIFWKPEFRWQVREIRVLRDARFFSIRRNEVNSRASYAVARRWEQQGGGYFADEDRAQRHTLALRDVAYIIAADVVVRDGVAEDPAKYRDQFRRRVERGQCYIAPYLGCREFPAAFAPPDGTEQPIDRTVELGRMLFDLAYVTDGSGRGTPRFFDARLERGVLHVPAALYGKDG